MDPASTATATLVDANDLPDLSDTLQQDTKRIIGRGSFGTVYRCMCTWNGKVAVKAISFPRSFNEIEKAEFLRKMRRELGIWRRLDYHPNIVSLLGTANGGDFGSDHPCMVSTWMQHGTLHEYIRQCETSLSLPCRIQLIKGTAAGLEYLHSKSIVHGDFHPGNILIDDDRNPCITDFGLSQTLTPQEQLSYLWTDSVRPGARMWVAPELLFPHLFPHHNPGASLRGDIYSLGSIIFFILSGKSPCNKAESEDQLQELKVPLRPPWPVILDEVWNLIVQCWSPQCPTNRPSAQEVLAFSRDRLEQVLQPNGPVSDFNVVLFGALGSGKSSIVNLLAEGPIAPISTNMEPCTKRPRCYPISIGERRFQLWDTVGFCLPRGGDISPLSPYRQAHTVLRNFPNGVHLILLCARMDEITHSLRSLYWLINDFFFGGHAPVALVVTHFDTAQKKWWELNQRAIINVTGIPIQFIPRACTTTALAGRNESRNMLRSLLEYATSVAPVPLRLDLSSLEAASHAIVNHCGFTYTEAEALVQKFSRPGNALSMVLFGKVGAGKSSVVNLIAGDPVAKVSPDMGTCTLRSSLYTIDTPANQFLIWDTMGFNGVLDGHDMSQEAVLNATRLIRDLSAEVDLLVFVKCCGKLAASDLNCYRFFEEFLCGGQVPVAIVVTHLEDHEVMEKWWEMNGNGLLDALGGNVIGHACITSGTSHDLEDTTFSGKLSESKRTVQALFKNCFSRLKEVSRTRVDGEMNRVREMTVRNLENHCGMPSKLAKDVIKLYNGSEGLDGFQFVR